VDVFLKHGVHRENRNRKWNSVMAEQNRCIYQPSIQISHWNWVCT